MENERSGSKIFSSILAKEEHSEKERRAAEKELGGHSQPKEEVEAVEVAAVLGTPSSNAPTVRGSQGDKARLHTLATPTNHTQSVESKSATPREVKEAEEKVKKPLKFLFRLSEDGIQSRMRWDL